MIKWAAVSIALVVAPITAQERPPTFRARTELVRVDVLVTDGRRPITGLTVADFDVRDSGVQQRIDRVAHRDAPLDAWVVLDESGSVAGDLDALLRAVSGYAQAHGSNDRIGLITLRHAIAIQADLTHTPPLLLQSHLGAASAEGYTSLRDALFVALAVREESVDRGLIVVFTDGQDTMSWLTERQLVDAVRSSDVVIYTVRGRNYGSSAGDDGLAVSWRGSGNLLRKLADETGGRLLDARGDLAKTFVEIVQEMKARYVLTYYPTGVEPAGWHPINVRIKHHRAKVQARRGYFVVQ